VSTDPKPEEYSDMQVTAPQKALGLVLAIALGVALTGTDTGARAEQQNPPQGGAGRGGGRGFSLPPLLMETDAFPDGGIIPQKYVGRGGVQPGFKFSNAPAGTVSYAVIFHDLDVALGGQTADVLHWMAWNIPASANGIPEGSLPPGSVQGNNIAGQPSYMGPGAPPGPRFHHYVFELYALNATLDLPATASRDDLLKAMAGKVVAKSSYVGRFRQGEAPAK
jgi:Raf kinase inhibitor-like YbhB/YbcL family protein